MPRPLTRDLAIGAALSHAAFSIVREPVVSAGILFAF
jgi:hypothetical protein